MRALFIGEETRGAKVASCLQSLARMELCSGKKSPNLTSQDALILDAVNEHDPAGVLQRLGLLRLAGTACPVLVLTDNQTFGFFQALLRAGVQGVLPWPVKASSARRTVLRMALQNGLELCSPAAVVCLDTPHSGDTLLPESDLLQDRLQSAGREYWLLTGPGLTLFETVDLLNAYHRANGGHSGIGFADKSMALRQLFKMAEAVLAEAFVSTAPGAHVTITPDAKKTRPLLGAAAQLICAHRAQDFIACMRDMPGALRKAGCGIADAAQCHNRLVLMAMDQQIAPAARIGFLNPHQLVKEHDSLESLFSSLTMLFLPLFEPLWEKSDRLSPHCAALLNEVSEHCTSDIHLSELVKRYHINLSYCSEWFRKTTGQTFGNYLLQQRMEKASLLFQTGTFAPREICRKVGYRDVYHFTHLYKSFLVRMRQDKRVQASSKGED